MFKCTINGHEVEVAEGTSVIEAFKLLDEDIAHYCWHPGLSIAGVCRLCMVQIDDSPRLQIACNTLVRDGMKITNQSEIVKEAVRWGMDFHLINHPLDCPICDQAGECGLQEQYMKYGQYDSSMAENKVKKRKVVDLGEKVVLDSERCILCSRCVRFTDEVSKTHELGIFNRGDHSEIGTFEDKPLDNKYSLNTVDICPVGALTSKDFRFQQRVWYLQDTDSICTGCSTGCSIKVYHNKEGLFRVKPVFNKQVNGHWMCDEGRDLYKHVNAPKRLKQILRRVGGEWFPLSLERALEHLKDQFSESQKISVVLTAQHTVEEYKALKMWASQLEDKSIHFVYWKNNPESFDEFDGLLIRGDKNPNTRGLLEAGFKFEDESVLKDSDLVLAPLPENPAVYPTYMEKLKQYSELDVKLCLLSVADLNSDETFKFSDGTLVLPLKTAFEKSGHFVNHQGLSQKIQKGRVVVKAALALDEFLQALKIGKWIEPQVVKKRKFNEASKVSQDLW